jgi:hypothetical protein
MLDKVPILAPGFCLLPNQASALSLACLPYRRANWRKCWCVQGHRQLSSARPLPVPQVVRLLAYISDKDLFSEFYRKRLSRRLLHDKSASEHHEKAVLGRLKQQCGAQFTQKARARCLPLELWPCFYHAPCRCSLIHHCCVDLSAVRMESATQGSLGSSHVATADVAVACCSHLMVPIRCMRGSCAGQMIGR